MSEHACFWESDEISQRQAVNIGICRLEWFNGVIS